jgi:ubiquinone/menaquinone biosynthesis C-methylase UbiE
VNTPDHEATIRRSFNQQTGLFTGDDAVFAQRRDSGLAWLEPLRPDMIVLDAACGAGHLAEQVAPHVRQVVALDLTPALLRLAADRLRAADVPNVLLQEGNAGRLPFADGSFDLVLCRAAVHHFPDPRRTLAELARVCRPGGRVAVSDMVAPGPEVRDRFDELHRRMDPSHARTLLQSELADLLSSTVGPLALVRVEGPGSVPLERILPGAADRDRVLAELRAEIDGGPATGFGPAVEDGRLCVSFTSAVIQATREPVPPPGRDRVGRGPR